VALVAAAPQKLLGQSLQTIHVMMNTG